MARQLGECQKTLQQHELRLTQLQTYREQYIRDFLTAGSQGIVAREVQGYRVFLSKLDQAITQQRDTVKQALDEVDIKKRQWFQQRSKKRILNKVIDRYREQEQNQASRQEQLEGDERAQRMGHREHQD